MKIEDIVKMVEQMPFDQAQRFTNLLNSFAHHLASLGEKRSNFRKVQTPPEWLTGKKSDKLVNENLLNPEVHHNKKSGPGF